MRPIRQTSFSLTEKIILNHDTAVDLQAGFSLDTSTLPEGVILPEATPITKAELGLRKVCKQAKALAFVGNKTSIQKDINPFKIGDIITGKIGGNAYAITAITDNASDKTRVDITTATAIDDATSNDGFIYEASAEVASGSTVKNKADILLKFHQKVEHTDMVIFTCPAYTQNIQLRAGFVAPQYLEDLKNYAIREIKY